MKTLVPISLDVPPELIKNGNYFVLSSVCSLSVKLLANISRDSIGKGLRLQNIEGQN